MPLWYWMQTAWASDLTVNSRGMAVIISVKCPEGHLSMAKVPNSCKYHGDAQPIGCLNYLGIIDRPPWLNDRSCAGVRYGLQAVREREEGVGGGDGSCQGEDRLHGSEAGGIDTAHLACTDADRLTVAVGEPGVDDGV